MNIRINSNNYYKSELLLDHVVPQTQETSIAKWILVNQIHKLIALLAHPDTEPFPPTETSASHTSLTSDQWGFDWSWSSTIRDFSPDAEPLSSTEVSASHTPLTSDKWGFDWSWSSIIRDFSTVETLYEAITARRRQIFEMTEAWRFYIEGTKHIDPIYDTLEAIALNCSSRGTYNFEPHHLRSIGDGISGSYFLSDTEEKILFVVKALDEDIDCLNNPKGFASPYTESTLRKYLPLYLSSMRETLAYQVARSIGIEHVVPHTALAILECDTFHDQLDSIAEDERERYESLIGSLPIREKLCSVQEFVPNSKTLFEGLQELQMLGLSDAEIEKRFDQSEVEDANILIWTTYDTDGHGGNFLVFPKSTDEIGNEILGIKKIDNSLAFPEKNRQLRNMLTYLPNAEQTLSEEGRAKIAAISIEDLEKTLTQFGLEGSAEAMKKRLEFLKKLTAEHPEMTLKEINTAMSEMQ